VVLDLLLECGAIIFTGAAVHYFFGLLETEDEGINNPLKRQEPLPPCAVSHVRRPESSE